MAAHVLFETARVETPSVFGPFYFFSLLRSLSQRPRRASPCFFLTTCPFRISHRSHLFSHPYPPRISVIPPRVFLHSLLNASTPVEEVTAKRPIPRTPLRRPSLGLDILQLGSDTFAPFCFFFASVISASSATASVKKVVTPPI